MKGRLEIGARFGRLTALLALGGPGSKYICICDCGETKAISAYNMLKGDSSSCGCLAKGRPRNRNTTDLSGKKIGKLSVVDMAPHVIGLGRMWNCVCDCGSNKVVRGHHLLSGIVTSCGCRTGKAAAACKSGDIATLTMSSGREVLIDSADLNLVTQYKWRVSAGYAKAHDRTNQAGVDAKGVFLHRLVMGCTVGDGRYVDHINGNRLDNRKSNLRICSQAENMRNTKIRSDNRSGFKGVRSHKGGSKWTASISVNKKRTYLGIFDTPEAAYDAYCKAAQELHGEFANLGEVA